MGDRIGSVCRAGLPDRDRSLFLAADQEGQTHVFGSCAPSGSGSAIN